jgi:hypothetical protein
MTSRSKLPALENWIWRAAGMLLLIASTVQTTVTADVLVVNLTQRLISTPGAERVLLQRAADPSVASVVVLAGDLNLEPRMVERWHGAFTRLSATRNTVVALNGRTNGDVVAMVAPADRIVTLATGLIVPGMMGRHKTQEIEDALAREMAMTGGTRLIFASAYDADASADAAPGAPSARGAARVERREEARLRAAQELALAAPELNATEALIEISSLAVYRDWLRGALGGLGARPDAATDGLAAIKGVAMISTARAMEIGLVDAVGDSQSAVDWAVRRITDPQGAIRVVSFTLGK